MTTIIIVSMDGIIIPYQFLETACNNYSINKKTVYNHWNKRGYYEKDGIRIEKQKIL